MGRGGPFQESWPRGVGQMQCGEGHLVDSAVVWATTDYAGSVPEAVVVRGAESVAKDGD